MQREDQLQQQISQYDNPQKPHGFWQNLRHIAATAGNIAGDILAPSTMELIPGTQLHGEIEQAGRTRELAGLQGQDRQDQQDIQAQGNNAEENALREEQINNLKSEETTREHPQPKEPTTPFEAWRAQNPTTPISEWLKAQQDVKPDKPGNDFEQFYKDYLTDGNLPDSAHNRLMARKEFAAAGQPPQRAPQITVVTPGGQVESLHPGQSVPEGSMSPTQLGGLNANSAKQDKAQQAATANLDNELNLMQQFAANPSPTNDAAMLMHYIGATKPESMGKIRLNDRELKLFGGTRSSLGDVEALYTKVANGQSLTPQQRTDMVNTMTMIDQAAKRPSGASNGGPQAGTVENGYRFKGGDASKQSNWEKVTK
jgi:hypothetical protein